MGKSLLEKFLLKCQKLAKRDPLHLAYTSNKLKSKITALLSSETTYRAKKVFITFEQEEGKQEALRVFERHMRKSVREYNLRFIQYHFVWWNSRGWILYYWKELMKVEKIHGVVPHMEEPSEPGEKTISWFLC